MPVTHQGVSYFAADAHAHIYPAKIAEKATAAVGDFYGLSMSHVGLPEVLDQTGQKAGLDRFLVCSVATKVEQVRSINCFIQRACREFPRFLGLGAWHPDVADLEGELEDLEARGLRGVKLHPDFQEFCIDDPKMLPFYRAAAQRRRGVDQEAGDRNPFPKPADDRLVLRVDDVGVAASLVVENFLAFFQNVLLVRLDKEGQNGAQLFP